MPTQQLSLFAPLATDTVEAFVSAIQRLTFNDLSQFKTLTRIYKDGSSPQGGRPSEFVRLHTNASLDLSSTHVSPVIELIDSPEMNRRPVTSRTIHTVACTSGDPKKLIKSMGYLPAFAYFEQGYHLKIGSMTVRVYQIFKAQKVEDPDLMETPEESGVNTPEEKEEVEEEFEGLTIGDGETWIVQCDVDVKMTQPDDTKRGIEELLRFKKEMQGYIELDVVLDDLR